jgi:hypothetical protein
VELSDVDIKKLSVTVAAATGVFCFGAAPASAAESQAFGLQQTVNDPSGGEIGYTVTKFFPSEDAIPTPVSGKLYEVTVRADALNGMPTPVVPAFSAVSTSGQSYPALAGIWTPETLSGATLLPGGQSTGKIYFDAVGDAPTSVVYNGGGTTLTWIEPSVAAPKQGASTEGSGEASGAASESGSADTGAAADSAGNGDVAASPDGG